MSTGLLAIIVMAIVFFTWRNFMKNKEFASFVAEKLVLKHNIDLLDDTVCMRKINIKRDAARFIFYRVYSFDYNRVGSAERFRGYIVLRNGKFDEAIVSDLERADVLQENNIVNNSYQSNSANVIKFDD